MDSIINDNINAQDERGRTRLMLLSRPENLESAMKLLTSGADINITCHSGSTALFYACYYDNFELVKLLYQYGANINHQNNIGDSPLIWAIVKNNIKIFNYLISKNCDVDLVCSGQGTALICAIQNDRFEMCRKLILVGANLDYIYPEDGQSLVMISVLYQNFNITKLLIEFGADFKRPDNKGNTPLMVAVQMKNTDLIELLITHFNHRFRYLIEYLSTRSDRPYFSK